ncbi:hypothetical protein [Priestia megaterium]|uniref:hypothetical protein n=1 Tax=Priestia megaterium TaxID=1404 RepID=UPI002E1ECF6A|nr:hypothetical protein [Priestia megaterium]
MWLKYVNKFNGEYEVVIVKENITENEAYVLEEELMMKYGRQLVNLVNSGLKMNYALYDEYWAKRREVDELLKEAKKQEVVDVELAILHYKDAFLKMIDYEKIDINKGKEYTG